MDKATILLSEIEKKISDSLKIIDAKNINYGRQFKFEIDHQTFIFRVFYNNKNEIKYDYSTIKDDHIVAKLSLILENDEYNADTEERNFSYKNLPKNDISIVSIGTDESGKGDYFGSLVVAGVYVDQESEKLLIANGVADSKRISDNRIGQLAGLIKSKCPNLFSVIEIPPKTYNNLYKQFKNEKKNLNTLLAWGHAKAIEELLGRIDCKIAISDKFADEKYIVSKLQEKGRTIKLIQEHKAEKYTSVAAASILARERFLSSLKNLSSKYSLNFSKGVSDEVVKQAKDFVAKYGTDDLDNVAKLHFKTTEQVL